MKKALLLWICTSVMLITACLSSLPKTETIPVEQGSQPTSIPRDDSGCLAPRFPFSYQIAGKWDPPPEMQTVLPSHGWVEKFTLPEFPPIEKEFLNQDWILGVFPKSGGHQETWIMRSWDNDNVSLTDVPMKILIYDIKTWKVKTITPQVWGTEAIVGELFMTGDGTI